MRIIDINTSNIEKYGLFCKKSQKKEEGYQNKLNWIKDRFNEGLKYKLLLVEEGNKEASRGFIEYTPSEFSWRGIKAKNWMVIHCLWVIGKNKNKGYGSQLIELCIQDSKKQGMNGVVSMASKKGGWLPNSKIFFKNGFKKVDEYESNIDLFAFPLKDNAQMPQFSQFSHEKTKNYETGITIFYTDQCPYLPGLIGDIEDTAKQKKASFQKIYLDSIENVRNNCIHPYGTFSIICNGNVMPYKPGIKKDLLNALSDQED